MEDNNDFEKYEGYKDSVETLLGTNEKSSSMSSRERLDETVDEAGAEFLSSSMHVPKGLAKKAVKEDGGKFAPTHGPTQKIAENWSRNKLAKGIDKVDNLKSSNGREAFSNSLGNRNYYSDKKDELENDRRKLEKKREENSNKMTMSQAKIANSQNVDDKNKAEKERRQANRENRNLSKQSQKLNKQQRILKKNENSAKRFEVLHPVEASIMKITSKIPKTLIIKIVIAILILLLFIFICMLIYLKIVDVIENTAISAGNTVEKIDNFLHGYGFDDSQKAFYNKLDDLCSKYGCSTNDTGLNPVLLLSTLYYTETSGYGDTNYGLADEINDSDEDDSYKMDTIKDSIKKFLEASNGTTDENGITYTAGQIQRLKKLAKNQVSLGSGGTYIFDEEKYKKYLFDRYFESYDEYKQLLGSLNGDKRKEKKEQIYLEIRENEEFFYDVYMENVQTSSESYTENCIGAIDSTLVSKLKKPVTIDDNINISFDDEYGFGTLNGKVHNGVDLNEKTANIKLGADVYSIANGKVVSISDSKCGENENCGKSIKISHDLIIDSKEYKFFSIYSNIVVESSISVNKTIGQGDKIGAIYNSQNNIEGLHFAFMDANEDSNGILIDPTNLFIPCLRSSSSLVGNTSPERVWNYFLNRGYNKFMIAAIMGNIYNESGFRSNNLEDSCENVYNDDTFTAAVNSGSINKNEFMQSTRICTTYGDGRYGYGFAQWTDPGRKSNFYDKKVEYNVGIDDEGLQLDLLYEELEGNWNYPNHKNTWKSASSESDINSATTAYCEGFEVGTGCSSRGTAAWDYYNQFKDK